MVLGSFLYPHCSTLTYIMSTIIRQYWIVGKINCWIFKNRGDVTWTFNPPFVKERWIKTIMDIHDDVELIMLGLWLISVVGIGILGKVHFKNKRLEQFRNTADNLMKSYVHLYDKENLSSDQKINRIGNAVIDGLEAKGFKLNEQEMQDIFREVAKEMNAQQDTQDK